MTRRRDRRVTGNERPPRHGPIQGRRSTMTANPTEATAALRAARELLLRHATDLAGAIEAFRWPEFDTFNWAIEWFDVLAREHPDRAALTIVEESGARGSWTWSELSTRSDQLANWLRHKGVRRGDRVILMLGNQVELWETILAAIKLGAVLIPASTLLAAADLRDRVDRGRARFVIARGADVPTFAGVPGDFVRIAVGGTELPAGWLDFGDSRSSSTSFEPDGPTPADSTLLLYFTSGTTALPKLVEHTHVSYPVGHLSTLYWIGLREADVHLNISSPGWAKHAWSNV